MRYIFKGKLCGYICTECPESLSNVKARLYRTESQEDVIGRAVASAKETFALLDDEAVQAKQANLIAEADTDEQGNFSFELGDKQQYGGGAFEIDVYCGTVPRLKPHKIPPRPVQFSITTLQPRWRETENGLIAIFEYCIPSRYWCAVRARFGAWTICGRLRTCAAPQTPIAGATVKAFDADWWQDDPLGAAVTDATGRFRIDYSTADFRVTPFSPFINVEFTSGPDVYFIAEVGGVNILDETQADGRRQDRENVSHCFCVELCSDEVQPPPPDKIPHWQQVEIFDIHPFPSGSITGFSAEGYAGGPANSYVFGGGVTLKGNCPLRNAAAPANPLEYRFQIGEWTWSGGAADDPTALPTVAPGSMTPVTQIVTTHVGYVFYINALGLGDSAQVNIEPGDLAADGWIRVDNKAVTVDMRDGTTSVVNVNNSNFLRTFDLFVLNSPAITSAHPAKLPGNLPIADAGRSLTVAEREPIRRYRLTFEVRDATTLAAVATDTLDSIVLDNSPVAIALDLEELRTNACNPVSNAVHILYTIDHPHLRFFSLGISNNTGGVHPPPPLPDGNFAPPPPTSNYLFRGGAGGAHQPANNGGFAVDVSADNPCAYRVVLSWQTRHYLSSATSTDRLYCK